ncbi:RnfABCDGE type electron transport complex subunit B [Halomonas huangheensis]|nr:RnfABCDGE type electron transport complex subunit B [Halomonas huangheensis]ALM54620.1 electron transporter RnfB [Halomonas huangheensis]
MNQYALIEAVDAALPQTQCGKCGHDGCRPYAEAIAVGEPINRCPPGGDSTVVRLAELTDRSVLPLEQPAQLPLTASIREDECIGCTKCIQACPVDAILGAAKQMHTVITEECTGCELCVAPCPVDCIDLLPHPDWQTANSDDERRAYLDKRATSGRQRFVARKQRLAREAEQRERRRAERKASRPVAGTQQETSPAPTVTGNPRTKRISLVARLKRTQRQLQSDELTPQQRMELEQVANQLQVQINQLDQQGAISPMTPASRPSAEERQQRLAVNAAEQARRRANQQLAHAERQNDSAAIASAHQQIEQAEQLLQQARETLAHHSS